MDMAAIRRDTISYGPKARVVNYFRNKLFNLRAGAGTLHTLREEIIRSAETTGHDGNKRRGAVYVARVRAPIGRGVDLAFDTRGFAEDKCNVGWDSLNFDFKVPKTFIGRLKAVTGWRPLPFVYRIAIDENDFEFFSQVLVIRVRETENSRPIFG